MMPRTIFLRVGKKDRVPLAVFINALQDFLGMLRDLDAAISKDQRGSVVWEVVSLRQNSPPIVGVSPIPRPQMQDFSSVVETQMIETATILRTGGEPTTYVSYSFLTKMEHLAEKSKQLGPHAVYVDGKGRKSQSEITEATLSNVQRLTGVRYSGYGSITGKLEAISVHRGNEFRVWDEQTGRAIRCKFDDSQESHVKSLLRSRVVVTGTIKSNSAGVPIAMELDSVVPVGKKTLPTIEEMSGFVPGITEGKSLKEYLEELGDE